MPDIGFTNLPGTRENGTNSTFYDTNSYLPLANQTIILATTGLANVAPPIIPGVSGNGVTWSLVLSQLYDFAGGSGTALSKTDSSGPLDSTEPTQAGKWHG